MPADHPPAAPAARRLAARITLVLACLVPAGAATAQTCAAPLQITANTAYAFDTCQGDSSLLLACGVFPLGGPATVVGLDLPYPGGSISVQSMQASYEPYAFLLHADCNAGAPCSAAAFSPAGSIGLIDLSPLDSGRYYLVIAAAQGTNGTSCGPVLVSASVTPEQEALIQEGVFRSGNAPFWTN